MSHVRIRIIALGVLAALTALALTASSASALPEFGQCFKIASKEGKYTNNVCTAKAKKVNEKFTGEFEWRKANEIEASKRKLIGKGGAAVLQTTFVACNPSFENLEKCRAGETEEVDGPLKVECEKERNRAELTPSKSSKGIRNLVVSFVNCKIAEIGLQCENAENFNGEKEILTNPLKGKLGWLNKGAKPRQVGIVIEPMKKGEFVTFNCAGLIGIHVGVAKETEFPAYPPKGGGDGIISSINPVNEMTTAFTQVFKYNEATEENEPNKFEGTAPRKVLEDWSQQPEQPQQRTKWGKAGQAVTNVSHPCAKETISLLDECENSEFEPGEIKAN